MRCSRCGYMTEGSVRFCRGCGAPFGPVADPDENMGMGIAKVIAGDGFFMVSIFLSAVESDVQSHLWLLLLVPAFVLFGLGFADIFRARQARKRNEANRLETGAPGVAHPPGSSAVSREDRENLELPVQSAVRANGSRRV